MTKLIKIGIEAITKDTVHYILTYSTKNRWCKEVIQSIYLIHAIGWPSIHKIISGTDLMDIVDYQQDDVIHAKLMLIIEQGKNEYIFKHETSK